MALKFVKSNFNDRIKFKPTEYGLEVMKKDHAELYARIGKEPDRAFDHFKDEEGYFSMQVHAFMHQFGHHMSVTTKEVVEMAFFIQAQEETHPMVPHYSKWICTDRDMIEHGYECTVYDVGETVLVYYEKNNIIPEESRRMDIDYFFKSHRRLHN